MGSPVSPATLSVPRRPSTTMRSPIDYAKRSIYLWSYVLAEAIPFMRQRLHLAAIPEETKSDHCNSSSSLSSGTSCNYTLDAASTRRLLLVCTSRRLSLDNILLASLFLASSEAVKIEQRQAEATRAGGGGHAAAEQATGMRLHKSLVLGIVCVVMALLSGSVDSKAMRYFCSLYAVVAGIWAVNIITTEKPGRAIIMATSISIKVGIDAAEETFTPVRLSVDCGRDLWDTAERLRRESRAMACPMSSYAMFKMRVRHARRLGAWWLGRQESPSEEAMDELFGCIRLEGTSADGTERRLTPEETLPSSPSCASTRTTAVNGGETEGATASSATTAAKKSSALDEGGAPLRAQLILTALDSKYTLFYREKAAVIDRNEGDSDHQQGIAGTASGGDAGARETLGKTAAPPPPHDDKPGAPSRLKLTLVEGTRALRGRGSNWLLDRSKAVLLQGIRDITVDDR